MSENDASRHATYPGVAVEEEGNPRYMQPLTPGSPLRSALKVPGTPGRLMNPLSPTFREEQILEKQEESTEKQQAKDLVGFVFRHRSSMIANQYLMQKVKTRVRMAKVLLRGVNFSCSLIVLAMVATVFAIFNATKHLPPRSGFTPWSRQTSPWPQIVLLVIACISLVFSIGIIYAYWRHGHKRAEKAAVYYTVFSVVFFAFSIIMWGVGAGILNSSKNNGNGQDLWGWSCRDNRRAQLFQNDVSYALVCRLQVSPALSPRDQPAILIINSELVSRLLHHRNRCGNHNHRHLRHRLLPLLQQTQATQVDGRPRPSSFRSIPRPAAYTISAKHSWLRQNSHVRYIP